jgi:hypothetical protein
MTAELVRTDLDRAPLLRRLGALAGAGSVVAAYAGLSLGDLGGAGLDPTMTPEALVAGLRERAGALRTGAALLSVGAVLAAVFAGALWQRLRAASGSVAVVGAAGAVLAAVLWLSFAADGIGLATAADLGSGAAAQTLVTTGWESARVAAVPSLVMAAAVVTAAFAHRLFPRWYAWVSAATLAPLVVALTPIGPSGLLGFFFGGAWLVITSVLLAVERPTR